MLRFKLIIQFDRVLARSGIAFCEIHHSLLDVGEWYFPELPVGQFAGRENPLLPSFSF